MIHKNSRTLLIALAALFSAGTAGSAPSPQARESCYAIYSKGFKVGDFTTHTALLSDHPKKTIHFDSSTRIHANLLVYSYSLESREEATIVEEGAVRYHFSSRENGRSTTTEGHLDQGAFRFTTTVDGVSRTFSIPRDSYDFTTMECPEAVMRPGEKEKTLRVLDFEHLTVVRRTYRFIRTEELTVEGKKIVCKVIDMEDPNKKCRRWIREDPLGVFIARQDGRGKGGSYSVRLASMGQKGAT